MTDGATLACDLTAIPEPRRDRHRRAAERLLDSVEAVREAPDGFRLRLPGSGEILRTAAEFISGERLCCPFLRFGLEVSADGGPVDLVLAGDDGVKEYLRANLVPHLRSEASDHTKTPDELREIYEEMAPSFDRMSWANRLVTGRARRRLFGRARGRVLDVACGVGTNLHYLPDDVDYVGVDLSPDMLARARDRWARPRDEEADRSVAFRQMDAEALGFPDDAFDTVVSSLSTCTFPDPGAALREMARVCRPDGRILLLEHGRSDVGFLGRFQDWRADAHYEKHGCRWNQEPVDVVAGAGLRIVDRRSSLLGVLTEVEARPPRPGSPDPE